jgi:hypothetical protein
MPLNPDFIFSANSMQDYLDCPRRFELKYLFKQAWPAIESKPVLELEHRQQLGNQFHQLVHQYLTGIPENILSATVSDADLDAWFRNFLEFIKPSKYDPCFTEFPLRMAINGFQVMSVYDLLGVSTEGILQILDWKTGEHLPKKENLAKRVQTILYPYMVLECMGSFLPQRQFSPEQIQMTYWFAVHPGKEITYTHDKDTHHSSEDFLTHLISEIQSKEPGSFDCTQNTHLCNFCVYRSLCERGKIAGNFNEMEEEEDLDQLIKKIDFDDQDEIAFS